MSSTENYQYRGARLASLTFFEYSAYISVRRLSDKELSERGKGKREAQAPFAFDDAHPHEATHAQFPRASSSPPWLWPARSQQNSANGSACVTVTEVQGRGVHVHTMEWPRSKSP